MQVLPLFFYHLIADLRSQMSFHSVPKWPFETLGLFDVLMGTEGLRRVHHNQPC